MAGKSAVSLRRSFDVVARTDDGSTDYRALLRDMTKDCDYSLGVTEPAAGAS